MSEEEKNKYYAPIPNLIPSCAYERKNKEILEKQAIIRLRFPPQCQVHLISLQCNLAFGRFRGTYLCHVSNNCFHSDSQRRGIFGAACLLNGYPAIFR